MYKLFNQQIADIKSQENLDKIRKIVDESITYQAPKGKGSFVWSNWFYCLMWFTILGGLILMSLRSEKAERIQSEVAGRQYEIYQKWFNTNYEDVKVEGISNTTRLKNLAYSNRGACVPSDARIYEILSGVKVVTKNGTIIETVNVLWKWVRRSKDSSVTYYYRKLYTQISNVIDRYEGFNFEIHKDGIFDKASKELENDKFNKEWIYHHNDPVKLRMLLTPSVQEDFLNNMANNYWKKSFSIAKSGSVILASIGIPENSSVFRFNFNGMLDFLNRDAIINNLVNDISVDLSIFQSWLLSLSTLRTLL